MSIMEKKGKERKGEKKKDEVVIGIGNVLAVGERLRRSGKGPNQSQ